MHTVHRSVKITPHLLSVVNFPESASRLNADWNYFVLLDAHSTSIKDHCGSKLPPFFVRVWATSHIDLAVYFIIMLVILCVRSTGKLASCPMTLEIGNTPTTILPNKPGRFIYISQLLLAKIVIFKGNTIHHSLSYFFFELLNSC